MLTPPSLSLVEAFLLIDQPRQRLGHWTAALASLDSPLAPPVVTVVAYYDPSSDQALLNLQYDESILGESRLEFIVNVALLAEVGLVQPAELSEGERVRFLAARLTRCTIRITTHRSAVGALGELVRRIKDERSPSVAKPPPIPAAAKVRPITPSMAPRGDVIEPSQPITAKGTRDNMPRLPDDFAPATSRHIVPRGPRRATAEMEPDVAHRLASEHTEVEDDRITSPMALDQLQALANEPAQKRRLRPPTANDFCEDDEIRPRTQPPLRARKISEPYLPTSQQPNIIYARYLRGGRWVPVRVGALSLKGAALLAGALPRLKDRVDVALTFGTHRALVRGEVAKLSTVREAASTGAATFSLSWQLDEVSRRQLTALLMAAREAKITIKPPPPRSTRRFPVEWQVALGTKKGAIKAVALDVSTGGMFVRSPVPLELGTALTFSVLLDDGGTPISGSARVIRKISEPQARTCGLAAGFGLGIVEMAEADRMRWLAFLARIERRAEKRVLIGAEPGRLAELQAGLASLGYTVCGGTDPGTLVQLANADARPADAVLIDSHWLQNEASTSLVESLFSARNVPCVTMHGEVRRARQALDRLLEVVV